MIEFILCAWWRLKLSSSTCNFSNLVEITFCTYRVPSFKILEISQIKLFHLFLVVFETVLLETEYYIIRK